jgi:small subunit ribosomal protein S12
MPTFHQLSQKKKTRNRALRNKYCRTKRLRSCPQRLGSCVKVFTTSPKKPNSSVRKICKVRLSTGKKIRAAIPGQGHALQQYSTVLVRGGRCRDIPGIHYKLIRGKYDFISAENIHRTQRRSKYGLKKPKFENENIQ